MISHNEAEGAFPLTNNREHRSADLSNLIAKIEESDGEATKDDREVEP